MLSMIAIKKKFKTFGVTKIITNKNYIIESEDVTLIT